MNVIHKLALGVFALGLVVASACSSNEEEAAPSRTPPPPSGSIDDAGGGGENDGGGGGTDGGGSDCFDSTKAKPTTPAEFLNQCNENGCFKFDNSRIEGYTPGGPLPPLN